MVKPITIDTITFDDLGTVDPVYTYSDVLKDRDFKIFAIGQVVSDTCDPTSPAFAHDSTYMGPVTFRFSDTVSAVSFDAGCFDAARSTRVVVYGEHNFRIKLQPNLNSDRMYAHFSFDYGENAIKKIVIKSISEEPSGFAVDNLSVTVRDEDRKVSAAGDINIDNLVGGTKWAGHKITYSFLKATSEQPDYGTGPETFDTSKVRAETSQPFSAGQKAMTFKALDLWDDLANINFQRVGDVSGAPGILRFARADIDAPADAFLPEHAAHGGDVRIDIDRPTTQSLPGSYDFFVFIHELGHALGLKHPHGTRGTGVVLPANQDSLEFSVMSYRSYPGQSTDNVTNAEGSYPHSLMMNDIAAIQYLYGANFGTNSGNTTYTFDPAKATIFETVWDGGGNDTYDASAYSVRVSLDLRPGKWSVLEHAQLAVLDPNPMDTHLARGSVFNARLYNGDDRSLIENAVGGSKGDTLIGNDGDNDLMGRRGNDILDGIGGSDTLQGQKGNDDLYGGPGADSLIGGQGRDELSGNKGFDHLIGGPGHDSMDGGLNNDVLRGGRGQDTMTGGLGNDVFAFRSIAESGGLSTQRDHIADFTHGDDRIVISAIDADTTTPGNQDFNFIGRAQFSGAAGELRYFKLSSKTVVLADVNRDKVADFSLEFEQRMDLVSADFLL